MGALIIDGRQGSAATMAKGDSLLGGLDFGTI